MIVGSGLTGLETTKILVEDGNKVSMVEMAKQIVLGVGMQSVVDIRKHIDGKTNYYVSHKLNKIFSEKVSLIRDEYQTEVYVDTVVLSLGVKADIPFIESIKVNFDNVVCIGDARKVSKIQQAIESGYSEAYRLQ